MSQTLHFDADYVEERHLEDGTPVRLRPIQAGDKEQLVQGLAELSVTSRYLRFFTDKSRLSTKELEYLTEVDGIDHFALVAAHADTDQGLGVARFVRVGEGLAEPAIVVRDDFHNRGLGSLLLRRLSAAALERGIDRFVAEFLDQNEGIRHLLTSLSSDIEFVEDQGTVRACVHLSPAAADLHAERHDGSPVHRLLAEAAAGALELRHRLMLLKDP